MSYDKAYYEQNPSVKCSDQALLCRPMRNLIAQLGKEFGFVVIETLRVLPRQKLMVATKKSKTLKSRHLPSKLDGLSEAADLMPIGGFSKPMDWNKLHDRWDELCMAHKDPDFVVLPEPRISWDLGHIGILRKKRAKKK